MLGFVVAILILLGLVAAIGVAISFVLRVRSGETVSFPLRLLFRAYLYLISIVSIVILMVGLSGLVQAGLGTALGKEFSYSPSFKSSAVLRPVSPEERPLSPGEGLVEPALDEKLTGREEGLDRALKEGILNGLSFTLVGGVVLGLHLWGRRRLESEEERSSMLNRSYLILLLVIFSIAALIALPSAVFDTLQYYILDSGDEFRQGRPGSRLAAAIVTVPAWAYFLNATLGILRRQERQDAGTQEA